MTRPPIALLVLSCLLTGCGARTDSAAPERDAGEPRQAAATDSAAPASRDAGGRYAPRIVTMQVGGMTCQGCVARVSESIASVTGVRNVQVSLDEQTARVWVDPDVADTALTGAVRRAGPEFLGLVRR